MVKTPAALPEFSSDGPYKFVRTAPDVLLRHDISDEELSMLCSDNRPLVQDIMWVAVGTFGGSLVPAISAVSALNSEPHNFGNAELLECAICFAAAIAFIVTVIIRSNKSGATPDLATVIRERTGKAVENKNDE